MRIFIYMLCFGLFSTANAAVYKKVNPDGSVEYTDVPQKDVDEMTLEPIPTIPAFKLPPPAPAKKKTQAKEDVDHYVELSITSPEDDEGIRSNSGEITAQANLVPPLRLEQEHRIEWWLDGNKVEAATSLVLKLENVDRGTHRLQIRVVDFEKKTLIESKTIRFHVFRAFKKPTATP